MFLKYMVLSFIFLMALERKESTWLELQELGKEWIKSVPASEIQEQGQREEYFSCGGRG